MSKRYPRSLTSAALYGTSSILQLSFSEPTEESCTREALQYRDSKVCKVASAGIEVQAGRKWKPEKPIEMAESCLRQQTLVGVLATERAGLGYFLKVQVSTAQEKGRYQVLQEVVREGADKNPRPAGCDWGSQEED